jgi:hypothetical protein
MDLIPGQHAKWTELIVIESENQTDDSEIHETSLVWSLNRANRLTTVCLLKAVKIFERQKKFLRNGGSL